MKKLTVLMTTFNEKKEILRQAIDSILCQTIRSFDFLIIVDNPENKEIVDVLNEYACSDKRIKIFVNEKNLGLPIALNRGIRMVKTKYLARMDADDIAMPNRLEIQLKYLESNPDVALVGTNIIYIDMDGNLLFKRGSIATNNAHLKIVMKYANMFNHPTFMGRTEIFQKYMYRNLKYSQDYDLTCRLLEENETIVNISEYLLQYRVDSAINLKKKVRQRITMQCVQEEYRKKCLVKSNIDEIVEKKLKNINEDKVAMDLLNYDNAMNMFRNQKYFRCFINFIYLCFRSRIIQKDIYNLLLFSFYKYMYKF